ncbi:tRNA1(Val) (adenine(37)-N6)-methyltransferase [Pseudaestuariivita rosea]|uniref:tRNA1(Val) (adenine(37)-N6)-methyltransferase n=1 Tax=Pseudaestuariivita rosea TaxID=2763263 RepID=UPI001ABA7C2B|nr:methyltransferase [Pseudaestuariivita rosea]
MTDLTCDDFLGGAVRIWQPKAGYRAGIDPVLLAAAAPAKAGDHVLELGCGVGTASLCLAHRVPGVHLTGVELQGDYADLTRRNAAENGIDMRVETCDLTQMPADLRNISFDHVIANPPYYTDGTPAPDPGRSIARVQDTPLVDWVETAKKRLKPKGWLTFIQRAERLPDLLWAMDDRVGAMTLLPIAARAGRPARLVILQAQKGSKSAARLLAPLILHEGDRHARDGDSYRVPVQKLLRDAAPLLMDR